jgi:uncharacterized protein YnzC (UPF0291/DUF896 family)
MYNKTGRTTAATKINLMYANGVKENRLSSCEPAQDKDIRSAYVTSFYTQVFCSKATKI